MSKPLDKKAWKQRQLDKKKENERLQQSFLKLIEGASFIPSVITTPRAYERAVKQLEEGLSKGCKNVAELIVAQSALQNQAEKIARENRLLVSLPQVPARQVAPRQVRDSDWFLRAREIHEWDNAFKKRLLEFDRINVSQHGLIGLTLYSAMSEGGLLDHRLVMSLGFLLLGGQLPTIELFESKPVIFFKIRVENGVCNHIEGIHYFRREAWFIDPTSFALLGILGKMTSLSSTECAIEEAEQQQAAQNRRLFRIISEAVLGSYRRKAKISSVADLASVALYPKEVCGALRVSEALINMASNHFANSSLTRNTWCALAGNKVDHLDGLDPAQLQEAEVQSEVIRQRRPQMEIGPFVKELRMIINGGRDQDTKATLSLVHERLKTLRAEQHQQPASILILLDYYIYLSGAGYSPLKKVGSLRQYHQMLSKSWIVEFYDQDLDALSEEDFISIYEEIIAFRSSDQAKQTCRDYLRRLHLFAMNDDRYRLPWLTDWASLDARTSVSRVNAVLFDFAQIQSAKEWLKHLCASSYEAEVLSIAIVLGFRLGLRIGEVLKIQTTDFEDGNLYIRANKYGDIKSPSARRQLDVRAALSDEELTLLRNFLARRKQRPVRETLLLTAESGRRLKASKVSALLGNSLKLASGNPEAVFHSLRHSAANIFHAVVEEDWLVAERLSGLDTNKLKKLRAAIVGAPHNRRDGYYAIASFLGHAQPDHSMSNYLHLTKWLLHNKLSATVSAETYDILARLTGIRIDSLKRSAGYAALNGRVKKALKPAFVIDAKPKNRRKIVAKEEAGKTNAAVGFYVTWQVLDALERGYTVAQVSEIFDVDQGRVTTRLANARILSQLVTREGSLRLFSKERQSHIGPVRERKELLVPKLGKSREECEQLERAVTRLREKAHNFKGAPQDIKADIQRLAWMIVNTATPSHSHVILHSPAEAGFLETMLTNVIPKCRWDCELTIPDGPRRKDWIARWRSEMPVRIKVRTKKAKKMSPLQEMGKLSFRVAHPKKGQILDKENRFSEYSTNTLVVLSHMLLIIMGLPCQVGSN